MLIDDDAFECGKLLALFKTGGEFESELADYSLTNSIVDCLDVWSYS